MNRLIRSLFLITFMILTIRVHSSLAQAENKLLKSPLDDIRKTFSNPPDLLNRTLKQVSQQETGKVDPQNPDNNALSNQNTAEVFKNPFIPQIPQEVKVQNVVTQPENPQPIGKAPVPIPQFTVSGLVWNSKKPAAILNGQIVTVGDEVSSWSISEITKDGVRISFEDQNLWVKPVIDPGRGSSANNQPPQPNKILRNYR